MFAGECKQLAFVKPFADRLRRPRHDREMGKADLAPIHGVGAARQVGQALTHRKPVVGRSEEHTSELSHGYISYAVFCLKKKKQKQIKTMTKTKKEHNKNQTVTAYFI